MQRFLTLVTDSQPNDIAVIDERGIVCFGNRRLADAARLSVPDLVGKTLASLFGPIAARHIEALNRRALDSAEPVTEVHPVEADGATRIVQSRHIPLGEAFGLPRSILLVNEDITDAVNEREKRARSLRDLVRTLLSVVDRRGRERARPDPYRDGRNRKRAHESGQDLRAPGALDG
jgi:PAS domain S-box-containing protein